MNTSGQSSTWIVGIEGDSDFSVRFSSEEAAVNFAHIDNQLTDCTAVVCRLDEDGVMTVVAEFHR